MNFTIVTVGMVPFAKEHLKYLAANHFLGKKCLFKAQKHLFVGHICLIFNELTWFDPTPTNTSIGSTVWNVETQTRRPWGQANRKAC